MHRLSGVARNLTWGCTLPLPSPFSSSPRWRQPVGRAKVKATVHKPSRRGYIIYVISPASRCPQTRPANCKVPSIKIIQSKTWFHPTARTHKAGKYFYACVFAICVYLRKKAARNGVALRRCVRGVGWKLQRMSYLTRDFILRL